MTGGVGIVEVDSADATNYKSDDIEQQKRVRVPQLVVVDLIEVATARLIS